MPGVHKLLTGVQKSSALWHGVTNIISISSAKIPNYMIEKIITTIKSKPQ